MWRQNIIIYILDLGDSPSLSPSEGRDSPSLPLPVSLDPEPGGDILIYFDLYL